MTGMQADFEIKAIKTEYMENPLGLDIARPRFSWRLKSHKSGRKALYQKAYQIQVRAEGAKEPVWDSGKVISDCQTGVAYGGADLIPMERYGIRLTVWNQDDCMVTDDSQWFETGLLDTRQEAWHGAEWIGAPEKYVSTRTMGVFGLTTGIRIHEGSRRAGIVFGANDGRLMDARKNQFELVGENYILYVLDVEQIPASLEIYRAGYAPGDRPDVPLAVVPVVPFEGEEKTPVITEENRYDVHELRIEVEGNCAYTFVDGILVDAEYKDTPFGRSRSGRQLNPLGDNDVTTFPRLCETGYYAGAGDQADFEGLCVYFLREPKHQVFRMEGMCLKGINEQDDAAPVMRVRDCSAHSIPMFRRDFKLVPGKMPEQARLYITARGIYDCRINGNPVTDTWLNPGCSQYDRHLMYQTYDVTELLHEGDNGIGVTLASGWWCDSQTFALSNYNYYGDQESFLAMLVLRYGNGSVETIVSNTEEWDYFGEGPYTYAGLFQGEHLDGRRLELFEDFSVPGFKCAGMKKPVLIDTYEIPERNLMPGFGMAWPAVDHSRMKLTGSYQAPVTEVTRLTAKTVSSPREGLYIYDLQQEIAGVPYLKLKGDPGETVIIRYGEMLYPKLPEYGSLHGMMLTENYRDAESIDRYILRGDPDGEIYCPRFTFHGFRYIEISGVSEPPAPEDVTGIQLSSVAEITGEITTSNPLLNRFIQNVKWSQYCNFISIPTDCPQRNERMGWAGDTHVFARAANYQADAHLFYCRYLQALEDLQEPDGQYPAIAPIGGGFGGITYEVAMPVIAWELYQQYEDRDVLREHYASMKKWVAYIRGKGMPGDAYVGPLDDWLALESTDSHLIWNAFYVHAMDLMRRIAGVLDEQEDADLFARLEEEGREYWNEHFVDPETGMTRGLDGAICDTQCSYALPLNYHLFSECYREKAVGHLLRKVQEADYRITTGFFGTGAVNPALTAGGHIDAAFKMIQQTAYPSWLYPVTQGATTIWERWNSFTTANGFGGNNNMNSFNHYSLGNVVMWIYEEILGIQRDEDDPGFRRFTLAPQMGDLDYAKGGMDTPYGRIESGWERTPEGYIYRASVPENTKARLILPAGSGNQIIKELDNGDYEYKIKWN